MKKVLLITLILSLILCFSPMAAHGTEGGGSYGTMQIEYRYTAGSSPNIPNEIVQFGRTYYLVSVSDPVLESTLPVTRTYTYRIEGALTEEQLEEIKNIGNIELTPMDLVFEREVDVEVIFPNAARPAEVLTNDVDDIPKTWPCYVTSGTTASGYDTKNFDRAGVTYELANPPHDKYGLPRGYVATVIYRGVETYKAVGYYYADATFTTSETESEEDVYVVVAEYRTDEIPPQINEFSTIDTEPDPLGGAEIEDFLERIALQGANPIRNIIDGLVPLGGLGIIGVWSFLSMIFSIVAIIISVIIVIGMALRRVRVRRLEDVDVYDREHLKLIKRRGVLLRILTIIFGAMTLLVWMYIEDFSFGMVWINSYTVLVGLLLAVTLTLCGITNARDKRTIGDGTDEDDLYDSKIRVGA